MMTMRLSCTVIEIRGLKDTKGHEFDFVTSRDVIDHVTVRSAYPEHFALEPNPK